MLRRFAACVSVPQSVPGKTVLTVPVSGSGSVPEGHPAFCSLFDTFSWSFCLVSQCSATRDTVAATPPVARHDFTICAWPT